MKKFLYILLALSPVLAVANDYAVVIGRKPNYVTVNQQSCTVQDVVVSNNNPSGAVVGGVAGAALGSTLGHNRNDKIVGTVIGGLVGGAIGNNVSKGSSEVQQQTVCRMVPVTVQQGEYVTFQYQGRTFTQLFQ